MDKQATIQELIQQATNTRHLVYEVAGAYVGAPPEKVKITVSEAEREGNGHV